MMESLTADVYDHALQLINEVSINIPRNYIIIIFLSINIPRNSVYSLAGLYGIASSSI